MRQLKILSQKSIYNLRFPIENSLINLDTVKFVGLKNYWGNFKKTENKNDYRYNYYNASDNKNISWLIDYLVDKWHLESGRGIVSIVRSFLVQGEGESIPLHNEILESDLIGSPDTSVIYTVDCGEEPVDIVFKYKKKGYMTETIRIPLTKNNYILYPSDIDHSIDVNTNKQPLVNLHFSFHQK